MNRKLKRRETEGRPIELVRYSHTMSLILSLVTMLAVIGLLVSACGSGGESADPDDQSQATETPRSERVERQATVMQQNQSTEAVTVQGQNAQDVEDADNQNRPQFGVEDDVSQDEESDDTESSAPTTEASVSASVIDFGHREGLPFARNVVGDPEAPVLIIEYSDFQ